MNRFACTVLVALPAVLTGSASISPGPRSAWDEAHYSRCAALLAAFRGPVRLGLVCTHNSVLMHSVFGAWCARHCAFLAFSPTFTSMSMKSLMCGTFLVLHNCSMYVLNEIEYKFATPRNNVTAVPITQDSRTIANDHRTDKPSPQSLFAHRHLEERKIYGRSVAPFFSNPCYLSKPPSQCCTRLSCTRSRVASFTAAK